MEAPMGHRALFQPGRVLLRHHLLPSLRDDELLHLRAGRFLLVSLWIIS